MLQTGQWTAFLVFFSERVIHELKMQVSTLSVIVSKKKTFLEWYVDFGSASS